MTSNNLQMSAASSTTIRGTLRGAAPHHVDDRSVRGEDGGWSGAAGSGQPWQQAAACKGHPEPDLWFAPDDDRHNAERLRAVAICNACPARLSCLQHAIEHKEWDGIWGGLTPSQRQRVAQGRPVEQRPKQPCGSRAAKRGHARRGESCSVCDGRGGAQCGTRRGHRRHAVDGTVACGPCVEAERFYQRNRPDRRAGARRAS